MDVEETSYTSRRSHLVQKNSEFDNLQTTEHWLMRTVI